MIRFGSVAAGRSLRTQSANLLIGGTRTSPNYAQIPPSNYYNNANNNSTLATSQSTNNLDLQSTSSYDWVVNNNDFKWNKDKSEEEFEEILGEIKMRLRRVEVPHSARPYVFRPKNAQLLRSLHLTDKEGNAYQSEVWKGPPNRKQLMKLIRRVTNPETAGIAQDILSSYIKHYPEEVQSIHIGTFLRTAARAGFFYKALDLIQTPKFEDLINPDVAKEAIRLYAIRAATLNKDSAYKDLSKLYQKMSKYTNADIEMQLDTHLVMVYGLAPYYTATHNEQALPVLKAHLAVVKQLLQDEEVIPADAKVAKYHGLQYYYMNLVLGQLGLRTLPAELTADIDFAKLDSLISGINHVFAANRINAPLERYVKHAAQGIYAETEFARERLNPKSAAAAGDEE